jgi:hypothetical protein
MAVQRKNKIALMFAMLILTGMTGACVLVYALLGDTEINIAQNANSFDTQEANRKLKAFNEAQAANKPGFVRLSEPEINGFLQSRYGKADKSHTNGPVQLVKTGVLLHQNDLTFVTWHKVSVFGVDFHVVWQRLVSPQRTAGGWRLSLDEMRVGKLTIPGSYWDDVNHLLGACDSAFEERKVWLANIPTMMISHNEITRAPEVRLYSYVPVIRSEGDSTATENLNTSVVASTNTVKTAKLSL